MFCHETRQTVLSFVSCIPLSFANIIVITAGVVLFFTHYLLTGFLSRKYSFGVDGSANDLCMLTSLAAIPWIDRTSIEPKSLITLTGCSRQVQTDSDRSVLVECDPRSVDLDMVELENSDELLVFMHLLAQETGDALEVYTNDQDVSRLRKTTKNCNYKPH